MTVRELLFGYEYDSNSDPRKILNSLVYKDIKNQLVVKIDGEYFLYNSRSGELETEGSQKDILNLKVYKWSIQASKSIDGKTIECNPAIWTEKSRVEVAADCVGIAVLEKEKPKKKTGARRSGKPGSRIKKKKGDNSK